MDENTLRSRLECLLLAWRSRHAKRRRGAILPLVAITLVGVMGIVALAIDGGSVQRERRNEQNAADAGAQAGAAEIMRNQTQDVVRASARAEATRNGYTHGVNGVTVDVLHPVTGEYFTGDKYVRVVITKALPTFFARIVGKSSLTVAARAIGGIITPSGYCLVALETSANKGLYIHSGADVATTNCNVGVRATGSTGLCLDDGSLVATGGTISVAGSYTGCALIPSPTPQTGVTSIQDPLSYLTMPAYSSTCLWTNKKVSSGTVTLNPGTYCDGLTISGGAQVYLNPGVYTMLGGGFRVQNNTTYVESLPGGVTFINTFNTSLGYDYKPILIENTTATVKLTANTTAPGNTMPGVLFYGDKNYVSAMDAWNSMTNDFQSGASSTLSGALYFPTQNVEVHSGSTTTITGSLIAKQLRIHNNTTLNIVGGAGGGSGYFALVHPSIVE